MSKQDRSTLPRLEGTPAFVAATTALVMVFLASGTPVPLYNTYREADGITDGGLAITTVCYLAVTALSLLVLGRLSDHVGRRPVAAAAVVVAAAGCLVLMHVDRLEVLLAGRMLQGLACGIASSALGSFVVDTAPARPGGLAAIVTSNTPPFAISLGALLSGALVQVAPAPRVLTYAIVCVGLTVCLVLILLCREPGARTPGALASLVPRVAVPAGAGAALFTTGAALVATWSLSGFYQAFSPAVTADHLGTTNTVVIAVVFSSVVILGPVGGTLTRRLPERTAMTVGLVLFCAAATGAVLSLHAGAIVPFLLASYLAGLAQGAANSAGMRSVLGRTGAGDHAGVLATVFLVSYAGAAGPGLAAGRLTSVLSVDQIADGYLVLVLVASAVALITARSSLRTRGPR
ncbi:MFS transporter [Cellulomonas sp. Marseille-Q8402]